MIRRLGIGCVLLAALAMPAGAAAKAFPGEVKNAAKHCKALRAQMGVDAFRAEFGAKKGKGNAFGKCVSKHARADHRAAQRAMRECKAEYLADPAAFLEKYGETPTSTSVDRPANPEGDKPGPDRPAAADPAVRAALHKCVKLKVQALRADRREALENAAKECKEERGDTEDSREAFRTKYGSNENGRNAFGKCVSENVRKPADAPVEPAPDAPATTPDATS